jgi:Uma2 family endonuclease
MPAQTAVSIDEYLSTAYSPDCDYVDGTVEERNLGEHDHARLQTLVAGYFLFREKRWGVHVVVEQRVQASPTRFRIPDVCVVLGKPQEKVFHTPPFICIEILSPEDRLSRVRERIDDYLNFGVPYVWLLDPQTRKAHRCTSEGMLEVTELRTENPEILVPVPDLFE